MTTRLKQLLRAVTLTAAAALGGRSGAAPPAPAEFADVPELLRAKKYDEVADKTRLHLKTNRFDSAAWSQLAYALHTGGRLAESIDAGKRAIELGYYPPGEMYNVACGYALLGDKDQAIAWLTKAFENHYPDEGGIDKDDDLKSLQGDPRFIALTGVGVPPETDAAKRWAWDLDFLARRMEQMHWNLFAKVSREAFLNEVDAIKKAAGAGLSIDRVKARLARLLAMVGDGHTTPAPFSNAEEKSARLPLHVRFFKEGLFVIGADDAHRSILGARVLRFGRLTAEETFARLKAYCSVDNDMGYLAVAPGRMLDPAMLQEVGACDGGEITLTVATPDGTERQEPVTPELVTLSQFGRPRRDRPGLVYANAASANATPLYLRNLGTPLVSEYLPDTKTVYFGFHDVLDNPSQKFADFIASLGVMIEDKGAENLVIDMRLNGGGNTDLTPPLLDMIVSNKRINRHGHLFVIISRYTFSAAQNTVNMLESFTNATFVGEPTGSRPAFVGESTHIVLPYSRLKVYCSSRYWQVLSSIDTRTWVAPQVVVEPSIADYLENRDRCMDAVSRALAG